MSPRTTPASDELLSVGEESPFARDADGYLIRADEPTDTALGTPVTGLEVDGRPVEPARSPFRAVPLLDEYGVPVHRDGKVVRRWTTIYDALTALHGDDNPTPVLCHLPHQRPAAVCRLCCVVVQRKEKKEEGETLSRPKVVPSCHPGSRTGWSSTPPGRKRWSTGTGWAGTPGR